jgi:hypothetical protein
MTWWQTLAVSLSSSALGGFLTAVGSEVLGRRQRRAQQRVEYARLTGAALGALREINPELWGDRIAYRRETPEHEQEALAMAAEKRLRWLSASDGLEVIAAQNPGTKVADLAEAVIDRGNLVSIRLGEVAHGARIDEPWRRAIPAAHEQAVDAARELIKLVQR